MRGKEINYMKLNMRGEEDQEGRERNANTIQVQERLHEIEEYNLKHTRKWPKIETSMRNE